MLLARNYPPSNLVRLLPEQATTTLKRDQRLPSEVWRPLAPQEHWASVVPDVLAVAALEPTLEPVLSEAAPVEIDPLYLFACQVEWEQRADPSAAWEVISAARDLHQDTRAHARSLLNVASNPGHSIEKTTAPHIKTGRFPPRRQA